MSERLPRRSQTDRKRRSRADVAAQQTIVAREQAIRASRGPDAGSVTENAQQPTITLKNGAVVEARLAIVVLEELQATLSIAPDEIRSLLALAEGRTSDADPRYVESLWAGGFLEKDRRTIRPLVRDILLNCYEVTPEGPVITPLRLHDAADLPAAERAQQENDRFLQDLYAKIARDKGEGPSRG